MSKFHYISLQQIVKLLWIPDDVRSSLIICLTGGVNKYGVSTSLLSRRQALINTVVSIIETAKVEWYAYIV